VNTRVGSVLAASVLTLGGLVVAAPTADAAVPTNLTGTWSGNLDWGNAGTPPTTLNISRSKPLRGSINVPGKCAGTWREISRSRNTILVQFTRTSGTGCDSRNKWRVSFPSKNRLHGAGVENRSQSVDLTRAGSCSTSLCSLS